MTRHNKEHRPLSRLRLAVPVILALVILAAAFAPGTDTASAQEGTDDPYIDLSVNLDDKEVTVSLRFFLEAKNSGTADAHGVSVEVFMGNWEMTAGTFGGPGAAGTSWDSIGSNGEGDTEGTWEIGTLRAGESKTLLLAGTLDNTRDTNATYMLGTTTAKISSVTGEAAALLRDNEVTVLAFHRSATGIRVGILRDSNAAVMMSVDDQYPQPGDSVKFTLAAINLNVRKEGDGLENSIQDVEVRVELSDGLEFASGWTPNPSHGTTTKTDNRSGTWNVGEIRAVLSLARTLEIQTTLAQDDIPLEERCFTAWVSDMVPPPDPGYPLGSLTACLGDDPPVLLEEGTLGVMTAFPCVGVLTYPCVDDAGLIVAAPADAEIPSLRAHGVGRFDSGEATSSPMAILRPENGVIIQVKDPEGRIIDAQTHSLTSGTTPSWQTARAPDSQSGNREVGGVTITWTRKNFNNQIADWKSYVRGVSVAGLNGNAAPGRLKIRFPRTGSVFLDPNPTAKRNPIDLTSNTKSTGVFPMFVEFSKLGTYEYAYVATLARTDTNENPNSYTATGTYIFHVGPIAELEVRDGAHPKDGGPNPTVPAGQRAFTIAAVNNGPDTAPAVEVELDNVPAGARVGSISDGAYDAETGVWTIGELETVENRSGVGRTGAATLTLLTSAEGAEITVAISNNKQYTVCIGSSGSDLDHDNQDDCEGVTGASWHATDYYDYIPGNSTTTVAARSGSGVAALGTRQAAGGISLNWPAQPNAAYYGVEVSEDGGANWNMLEWWVSGTAYTHRDVPVGATRHYRVHAIDEDRRRGIPFTTASATAQKPGIQTVVEYRDRVVVETVEVGPAPFAYFASGKVTRQVAENSAPGTPVGEPVAVLRNPENNVTYSLDGPDAALFSVERDSGQILVGRNTILDFESERTSYSVDMVAEPSVGAVSRTIVDIEVVDVAEFGVVSINPAGQPQVGVTLIATLTHGGGEPVDPLWQWQHSAPNGTWWVIAGATNAVYTPTEKDTGRRLRAIATYGEPGGSGEVAAAVAVTPALAGEVLTGPVALYDANGDGRIDMDEALAAVAAHDAGNLSYEDTIKVINAYYDG